MGVGSIAQFQMSEMIKKEQYTKADPDRVGELQNGKTVGAFSHDKGVKTGQKRLPRSTSLLKVIIEKAAPKKETRHTKKIFTYRKSFPVAELMR